MDFLIGSARPQLDRWMSREFSAAVLAGARETDLRRNDSRTVATEVPGFPVANGPYARIAASIFKYEIFPITTLTPVLVRVPLEVGDTVGACFHAVPGLRIFFASRVVEKFDEAEGQIWRRGFTYRTLNGHPELGEETFSVEKNTVTGAVTVRLRSWSRAGSLLTKMGKPVMRLVQARANLAALDFLGSLAS